MVALLIMCLDNKKNIILVAITIFFMVLMPVLEKGVSNKGLDDIRSNINRLSVEIIKDYPPYRRWVRHANLRQSGRS
ncbi:MAG: hypothetical protein MZV70_38805 [Desulfobacterales bacterium]|nr:hypothetical protein [Desulfobacterales bacterium]